MYQNIYHDRNSGIVHLWDDENGYTNFPFERYAYILDSKGDRVTMNGLRCKKVTSWSKELERQNLVFEHDVPIYTRVLIDRYWNSDEPSKNNRVLFFDIEVAKEGKYSTPREASNTITSIAYYDSIDQKYHCLILDVENRLEDRDGLRRFGTEQELLIHFLQYWQKVKPTIVTGWNCVSVGQNVWLENKIIEIQNVERNTKLFSNNQVLNFVSSGFKREYIVTDHFGSEIKCSSDHKIPTYIVPRNKYIDSNTIKNYDSRDYKVSELLEFSENNRLYLRSPIRVNEKSNLTYRKLLTENFHIYRKFANFDFIIDLDFIKNNRNWNEVSIELCQGNNRYRQCHFQRFKDLLTDTEIIEYFRSRDVIKFCLGPSNRKPFKIDISEDISEGMFYLTGLIFTDGHYSKYDKCFSFCNKDDSIINEFISIARREGLIGREIIPKRSKKDGCYYISIGANNKFNILSPFYYTANIKKHLNIELLSQISFGQFSKFVSGLIDGDGSVKCSGIEICNYDNSISSNILILQQIFKWNGIITNRSGKNLLRIKCIKNNENLIRNLELFHICKKKALLEINLKTFVDSKNKNKTWFIKNGYIFTRVKNITDTFIEKPMYDIHTSTNYFVCNGIEVHNCEFFDIPYLFNRLVNVLGDKWAKKLSPIGIVEDREFGKEYTVKIAGVSCLDYLMLYKNFTANQQPRYTLDFICNAELGRGKVQYEGSLDDLFRNDIDKFIEYNISDVELVVALDRKFDYIEIARGICHKGHVPYEDITMSSRFLDGALLTDCRRNNLITVRTERSETVEEPAEGAFVKLPAPGLYRYVYDLDLESEYPNNIKSLNISPETKWGRVLDYDVYDFVNKKDRKYHVQKINVKSLVDRWDNDRDHDDFEFNTWLDLKNFLDEHNLSISSAGILYNLDKKGLIPTILTKWGEERTDFRKTAKDYHNAGDIEKYKYYDRKQYVQKILLNSLYGVLLLNSFRFYDRENGESVTVTGQSLVKFSADMGNHYYQKQIGNEFKTNCCIYQDTDSCFFEALPMIESRYGLGPHSEEFLVEKTLEIAKEVENFINAAYSIYAQRYHNLKTHTWRIKQEMVGKTAFWRDKKKRYAMWIINKNGLPCDELEVKGFDSVRSDFPKAFRSFMNSCIENILKGKSVDDMNKIVKEERSKILKTENLMDILLPTGVKEISKFKYGQKGTPIHVKSAQNYNKLMDLFKIESVPKIDDGDKIVWAYLLKNPYGFESLALRGYDDPAQIVQFLEKYIDRKSIFEDRLLNKLQAIWDNLGWGRIVLEQKSNFF